MRTKVFALVLLAAALTACLRENYAEKEQVLELPELSAVTLEAEVLSPENVYDTVVTQLLNVRANRSWSAVIEYEGAEEGWLKLSEEELLNLHEYSVNEPVTLTASRNESTTARKAKIIFSSDASHKVTIPVEQKAQVRFLDVKTDRDEVLSIQDTVYATIRCNTAWTAAVDPEQTTAVVSLSAEEGKDNGLLKIAFDENFSAVEGKMAVVKLAALGVDSPKELVISQKEGQPYIEFRMSETELSPEISSVTLKFGASVNWTLAVKSVDGIAGASFSQETGGPTSTGDVVLNIPLSGENPGEVNSITIELSAPGLEPKTYTFTRKGCVHLDFLDVTTPGGEKPYTFHWQFADPVQKGFPASASTRTYDGKKLVLTMAGGTRFVAISETYGTTGGVWYNASKQGFLIGNGKYSRVVLPAFEGLTLKTIVYEPSYLFNVKVFVAQAGEYDGPDVNLEPREHTEVEEIVKTAVPGGELWVSNGGGANMVTQELMENHYFTLTESLPGVAYCLVSNNAGVAVSLKDLVLIYE